MLSEMQIWELIRKGKLCPQCGNSTCFTDSSEIYGKSYGMIYLCRHCRSYCGVHKGTRRSLGSVADGVTRDHRRAAHRVFDKVWKSGKANRTVLYNWLSSKLNIPTDFTHIGMFSTEECKLVIKLMTDFKYTNMLEDDLF